MSGAADKKLSKAVIIRQLQQVAAEKQRELELLQQEHQNLRTREVRPVLSGAPWPACELTCSSCLTLPLPLLLLAACLQEVLLQQVTQQGDNLHFVALAAAQVESSSDSDLAKTLVQDLEVGGSWQQGHCRDTACVQMHAVPFGLSSSPNASMHAVSITPAHVTIRVYPCCLLLLVCPWRCFCLLPAQVYELLGMLGRDRNSSGDGPEPFTTQRLRAAVTPERVAAMRATTVSEVAARLKSLTMRMCMLLAGGPGKAHLFADSIEAVVNEYGEYGLLLHVAADWINLEIGGWVCLWGQAGRQTQGVQVSCLHSSSRSRPPNRSPA
jgi:hypothetical protein